MHSLSLLPYVATASISPPDDPLLGPEELQLSLQPLAINADFERPAYPGTMVGGPAVQLEGANSTPKARDPLERGASSSRHVLVKTKSEELSPVALLALSSKAPQAEPNERSGPRETLEEGELDDELVEQLPASALQLETTPPPLPSALPPQRSAEPSAPASLSSALELDLLELTDSPPDFGEALQALSSHDFSSPQEPAQRVAAEPSDHPGRDAQVVSPPLSRPPQLPSPSPAQTKTERRGAEPSAASSALHTERELYLERVETPLKVPPLPLGLIEPAEHSVPELPPLPRAAKRPSTQLSEPLIQEVSRGATQAASATPQPGSSESFDGFIFQEQALDDELLEDELSGSPPLSEQSSADQPNSAPRNPRLRVALFWAALLSLAIATPILIDRYLSSSSTSATGEQPLAQEQRQAQPHDPRAASRAQKNPSQSVEPILSSLSVPRPVRGAEGSLRYRVSGHIKSAQPLRLKPQGELRAACISQLDEPIPPLSAERGLEVPVGCTLALELPSDQLPFGRSTHSLTWLDERGEPLSEQRLELTRPYELSPALTSADGARLEIPIKLAPGWRLSGSNQEGAEVGLLYVWSEELETGKRSVTLSLLSPEGRAPLHIEHPLNLPQQALSLELISPTRDHVTQGSSFILSGLTLPQAHIEVGGRRFVSDKSGYFEGLVPLPQERGELELSILVKKIAHEPLEERLVLTRLSRKRWRARRLKLRRQLKRAKRQYPLRDYKRLSAPEAPAQLKTRIRGEVAWLDRRGAEGSTQRLLLLSCAPAGCPVWVEAREVSWVSRGDSLEVIGTLEGLQSHPARGLEALEAPLIKAKLIAPRP